MIGSGLLALIRPPFVAFLDRTQRDVGKQRRDDPALRGAVFRAQELVLRKNPGLKELSDQPRHATVSNASAYPIHQVMVVDIVEAALDVPFNDPAIRQPNSSPILPEFVRQDRAADILQGAVRAPPGSEPVRDMPELRLEDRLQEDFDRALDDAIFDRRNAQGSELAWFTGFRDELASRRAGPICAGAQFGL